MIDNAAIWLSNHPIVTAAVLCAIVIFVAALGACALMIKIDNDSDDDPYGGQY